MTIKSQDLSKIKLERRVHLIKGFFLIETKDEIQQDTQYILVDLYFEKETPYLMLCEIIEQNKRFEYTKLLIKVIRDIKQDIKRSKYIHKN